jgi:hypothetical protein
LEEELKWIVKIVNCGIMVVVKTPMPILAVMPLALARGKMPGRHFTTIKCESAATENFF